jgi:dCTP deaminase
MTILSDRQIRALCSSPKVIQDFANVAGFDHMISPFVDHQVRVDNTGKKLISYGLSSFGYDVRLAEDFKIFTNTFSNLIDPLNVSNKCYVDHHGDYCIIPPNSYILGHTIETFHIPKDVMVICLGKSTYARCGGIVNVTPIEAGFFGTVVIEISNATNIPLKVYANQGIAQFLFFQGNEACEVSYADGNRKYQGQQGIVTARV